MAARGSGGKARFAVLDPALARGRCVALAAALASAVAVAGCSGTSTGPPSNGDPPDDGDLDLSAEVVASGLENPLHLTSPPGDDRLFVVEQPGRIRVVDGGTLLAEPFLDITGQVTSGGEQGLLSVAFHPEFSTNGRFYVNYTGPDGGTRVERYLVSGDPNRADPASAKLILEQGQPFSNHNGGLLTFGPDGMLYVGLGDGGGAGDPEENGQDRSTLLGSILRIDVDGGDPYAVPPDNPFVGQSGRRGELWAWGLRNPWRFAFDPPSGRLYVADVGQSSWEEVNAVPADEGGLNYGWNVMEGAHCFQAPSCDQSGLVLPVLEYGHDPECSVTGGHVYRGTAIPELAGHYFYADLCAGWVRSFRLEDGDATDRRQWALGDLGPVFSFGVDDRGELYVLSGDGTVYRLVDAG